MELAFAPDATNIVVPVYATGPRATIQLQLALDNGATRTVIRPHVLASLGIVPAANARRGRIRSATGGAAAPFVDVPHLLALGQVRANFDVLAHDLPPHRYSRRSARVGFLSRSRAETRLRARARRPQTAAPLVAVLAVRAKK